jgi:hypothetical protein
MWLFREQFLFLEKEKYESFVEFRMSPHLTPKAERKYENKAGKLSGYEARVS